MNDVTFTGAGIVIITALLTALSTVVAFLFKALSQSQADRYSSVVAAKDAAMTEMRTDRDNYRRMALQATMIVESKLTKELRDRGQPQWQEIPAVVPEHNSPVTPAQAEAAEFATLRARLAAAARGLNEEVPDVKYPEYDKTGEVIREGDTHTSEFRQVTIHDATVTGIADGDGDDSGKETIITGATITGTTIERVPVAPESDAAPAPVLESTNALIDHLADQAKP